LLLRVAAGAGTIAAVASVAACSSSPGGSSFDDVDASFADGIAEYPDSTNPCAMEICGIFDVGSVGVLDTGPSGDGSSDGSEEGAIDDAPTGLSPLDGGAGGDAGQDT
jgi:hypothetical protein